MAGKKGKLESAVQASILGLFSQHGWLAFKLDPGPMGPPKGVPDVLALGPGARAVFVETKREDGGKVAVAQRVIHSVLRGFGFTVLVPTTKDEVLRFLQGVSSD